MARQHSFAIVIPAHNEELIIDRTLSLLEALDYPKDRYEVIVVENGSTDATYDLAQRHASNNLKVYAAPQKGVSYARNFGFAKSTTSDWVIFMDCDVFVQPSLLRELDTYLEQHPDVGYGTTNVDLDNDDLKARFWSRFNNFFYRLFRVLFTIHVIRKDFADKVSYRENLVSGEDIQYGRDLAKIGARYFFVPTRSVRCSDRRFTKNGYIGMFFINLYHGITCFILPEGVLTKIGWEVIR